MAFIKDSLVAGITSRTVAIIHLPFQGVDVNIFLENKETSLPVWLSANDAISYTPEHLHHWLTDPASLTLKLSTVYQAELEVNVLEQKWGTPDSTELQILGMTEDEQRYVIRRVQLNLNDIPRVYARSIFPENCLTFRDQHINHLDKTPLGKWLFSSPELLRSPFEITQAQVTQLPNDAFTGLSKALITKTIWGRRSVFLVHHDKPILVTEYFITEMDHAAQHHTEQHSACLC